MSDRFIDGLVTKLDSLSVKNNIPLTRIVQEFFEYENEYISKKSMYVNSVGLPDPKILDLYANSRIYAVNMLEANYWSKKESK